jgi:hypothetical protein
MINKNKTNKQNTKQRQKAQEIRRKKNLYCWMNFVGVAPSSSTCTNK